ncbi:hybrid sensor histidine kinase/response regulator [Nostoc sp. T09]|uniref:hybrid sensor histidine kinase/response regulator n=1 Tax=Nostoc sp. T09 TaxID=1932621 RepID=UPI000A371725|nr:hybrid sensor histidine kinase/response regulator [Nostoc sp. T09]OUL37543.1 hybrid sensor histidine kinase/response regulator [Nostoc sp. T09]
MTKDQDFSKFSLLDLFSMEVKAQVIVLNDRLLALESKPQPQEELAALMRAAHSIKGAAKIVQLDAVVILAHVMEDCFVAAQEGRITLSTAHIDVLLQGVDMLVQIAEACDGNPEPSLPEDGSIQSLVSAIANILQPQNTPALSSNIATVEVPTTLITEPTTAPKLEEHLGVWGKSDPGQMSIAPPLPQPPSPTLEPATTPLPVLPAIEKADTMQNRAVRVSAENLNRLMGLAGESLVETKWLETFSDSLLKAKASQSNLSSLLDRLHELLGDHHLTRQIEEQLGMARQTATECRQLLSDRHNELELFCQRSANLADRLYRQAIATHMCPFTDGGQGFPRMVRDLGRQLGKRVKLEIIGKSTLVDRDILERLEAPLTHVLRNAIDHGIESPEERLAVGKPEEGTIRIEVIHRAGMLSITVADDGRGIELEFLRQEVVRKKLTHAEMAAHLTEAELMEFLFLPGFSTAQSVTEISGRGVGLDVAHSTIREVGGTLRAVSSPGKGMTFYLQLPLTLSVIRTLLVEIAGEPYAFALARIDQLVMLPKSEVALSENQPFFMLNDRSVGLISAHQVFDLPTRAVNPDFLSVIVISDRLSCYGLVVDKFLTECSLVVRPLDPRLGKVPNISAAALMDDGSTVLIVDVEDIVRSIAKLLSSGQLSQVNQSHQQAANKNYKRILVVDDSITVREMERKLLENNGYKVEVAVNGMDGWNAIRSTDYDLVITDIDMPRMNGFELTSQIKTHGKLKNKPVIIVSYKDREEDRLQGLEVGADYYLTKSSFQDRTLLKAVIDLIGEA